ncbi:hypothetical protein PFLCHA0_c02650 [Pseudomonas protegens CHA0]|uniref:Uncharacterized protein n=1 Tax=Pseudomonas protegens (strain DSM 19095 / LMG 27888 / CFBP 6595 / CHA0) TaxID=1124983 RepID=A0A2C9EEI4_PSEPH|nr:hypothetical protein PFLCHA0_c02650 [Pseudomonas protegens CHA0]
MSICALAKYTSWWQTSQRIQISLSCPRYSLWDIKKYAFIK